MICPNETEAARLTGISVTTVDEAAKAAILLRDRGARIAIVKRGEHGVVVASGDAAPRSFASFCVNAVDSTAAGDAFAGALGVSLAENQPLEAAIAFACAAGAIAASRPGAQPSMPLRGDVTRLVSTRPDVNG